MIERELARWAVSPRTVRDLLRPFLAGVLLRPHTWQGSGLDTNPRNPRSPGSVFVVPKRTLHKPSSEDGSAVLLVEPTGTLSVGDSHDEVPDYVDVTTGYAVGTE